MGERRERDKGTEGIKEWKRDEDIIFTRRGRKAGERSNSTMQK
jgi:hypothetical protein